MNKNRLNKLARHLESGNLGADLWDFDIFWAVEDCKTVACALGECRFLWPKEWGARSPRRYLLQDSGDPLDSACEWFGLAVEESEYLFLPYNPAGEERWGGPLPPTATPEEVAQVIRQFVKQGGMPALRVPKKRKL